MVQALQFVWGRGGFVGFYQGLIPWARISSLDIFLPLIDFYPGMDRSLDERRCASFHRIGD